MKPVVDRVDTDVNAIERRGLCDVTLTLYMACSSVNTLLPDRNSTTIAVSAETMCMYTFGGVEVCVL